MVYWRCAHTDFNLFFKPNEKGIPLGERELWVLVPVLSAVYYPLTL